MNQEYVNHEIAELALLGTKHWALGTFSARS